MRELDNWKGALEMATAQVRLVRALPHPGFTHRGAVGVNLLMVEGGMVVISGELRLSKARQQLRGHMPKWFLESRF